MDDPISAWYDVPLRLETARLCLRRITDDDVDAVYDYASRPETSAYVHWPRHESLDDSRAYVERAVHKVRQTRHFVLAVEERATGRMVGTFGVTSDKHRGGEVSLGYVLHPDVWGRGFATELVTRGADQVAMLRGVTLLKAFIRPENKASIRVIEKAGFTYVRPAEADEVPDAACIGAGTYVRAVA